MLVVYTDGACKSNGKYGYGGWAYVILRHNKIVWRDCGNVPDTTNNRMEITAVIEALKAIRKHFINYEKAQIVIHSDSAYVVNAWEKKWLHSWRLRNWKKADGGKVENVDLWEKVLFYTKDLNVRFVKVKGHADNEHNCMCDEMAQNEASHLQEEMESNEVWI